MTDEIIPPTEYTNKDAWEEVMDSLIDTVTHDTETFIQLVDILTGEEALSLDAEHQIDLIKTLLGSRSKERQVIIDRTFLSSAMIDATGD